MASGKGISVAPGSHSVLVLAVPHDIQGQGFGRAEDPYYEDLIKTFINEQGVDFIFEEASGRRPSKARDVADELLQGRYCDVDPPVQERSAHGIGLVGGGKGIDPGSSVDTLEWTFPSENRKREQIWLKQLSAKGFKKGLMICGLCHALSFALRLADAGIHVERAYSYIPFCAICAARKGLGSASNLAT